MGKKQICFLDIACSAAATIMDIASIVYCSTINGYLFITRRVFKKGLGSSSSSHLCQQKHFLITSKSHNRKVQLQEILKTSSSA